MTLQRRNRPLAARPWIANAIMRSLADDAEARNVAGCQWQSAAPPSFVHFFKRARYDENRSALLSLICAALLMTACLIALWPHGSDAQGHSQKAAETAADPSSVEPSVD